MFPKHWRRPSESGCLGATCARRLALGIAGLPGQAAGHWHNEAFRPLSAQFRQLAELFSSRHEAFRSRFRKTPLWRAKRGGLLRNAAIVLGNRPTKAAIPALILGLNDEDPLVRAACAWALGRSAMADAAVGLRKRLAFEEDLTVREEIELALRS